MKEGESHDSQHAGQAVLAQPAPGVSVSIPAAVPVALGPAMP